MVDMKDSEDQPLGYLLYRLMSALRPAVTAELQPLGLVLPEFVCLRILSMWPGRSNAELARNMNVSPQAMNNVVRGLQDRRRRREERDRRRPPGHGARRVTVR